MLGNGERNSQYEFRIPVFNGNINSIRFCVYGRIPVGPARVSTVHSLTTCMLLFIHTTESEILHVQLCLIHCLF